MPELAIVRDEPDWEPEDSWEPEDNWNEPPAGSAASVEDVFRPDQSAAPLASERRGAHRRRPGSLLFDLAGVAAGLCLLVASFAVYLYGFSGAAAYRSQRLLAQQLGGAAGLAALNGRTPAEGQAAGVIDIASLGLRQIVVEGTSARDLELGPGFLIGSAPAGTAGNVVVAGRRSTFGGPFSHIGSLRIGAEIEITAALGRYDYKVTAVRQISPGHGLPASPTSEARLTLVTAAAGLSPRALVVVSASLVGKPVARVPLSAAAVPSANFGLGGDSSALAPSLLWGEAAIVVLVLAVISARRSRRTWLVYGLAAPVVVALLLLLFENLAGLLPATL